MVWNKGLTKETDARLAKAAKALKGKFSLPREIRVCECGCEETFECKVNSSRKFKDMSHYSRWKRANHPDYFDHTKIWNEGLTKETDERVRKNGRNISKSLKGNPKLGGFKSGKATPMFGRKGSLSPTWEGGASNQPYPFDFNDELRGLIRERDNHTCQLCGKTKENSGKKLCVHHIDYAKENLDPSNLITLCNRCNAKVNHGRSDWQKFFERKLKFA